MATTGPSKTSRKQREICVKEEFKIAVKIALDRFRFEETQKGRVLCLWVVEKYRVIICFSCLFFVSKKQPECLVSVGCDCFCTFQKGNKLLLEFF